MKRWEAKQKQGFCRNHFFVQLMLPCLFWACTSPTRSVCDVKAGHKAGKKWRERNGRSWSWAAEFRVSVYPEWDRLDKAPLVLCHFLYGAPLPRLLLPPSPSLRPIPTPLCPHPFERCKIQSVYTENVQHSLTYSICLVCFYILLYTCTWYSTFLFCVCNKFPLFWHISRQ